MAHAGERLSRAVLLQKGRVVAGDYGTWQVAPEHHGLEIWLLAEPPRRRRFCNARGQVADGMVYRRADGLVARVEYIELLPEFQVLPEVGSMPAPDTTIH